MGKKHYIDNKRFEDLIFSYKENSEEENTELVGMFDMLISNILIAFGFKVDVEDAKQDCFLLILKSLPNFDRSKGSAFNYYTTIILNNLKLVYTKNKRYTEKIKRFADELLRKSPTDHRS